MAERTYVHDGPDRRWVSSSGSVASKPGEAPPPPELSDEVRRLLARGVERVCRWSSAGRAAGCGIDQVAAETLLWTLVDAGLVRVRERRNRRGDWEPYQWTATEAGARLVAAAPAVEPADIAGYLGGADPADHRILSAIRAWLAEPGRDAQDMLTRLVIALGREFRAGRLPRARLVSVRVGGHTKAVDVRAYRDELEAALGFALDELVLLHGRAVLAFGPFSYRLGGHVLRGDWSVPWIALTPETLGALEDVRVEARRVLSIENLVAFEEAVRRGLEPGTIAVFTAGFPGLLEREFVARLIEAGVEAIDHWGDLDVGGLRILRHLQALFSVPVRPYRMDPELVARLPGTALSPAEREALEAWLDNPDAPHHALARALLEHGRKVEQEAWFLLER